MEATVSDEANTENLYGTSPPSTPRQMKRMSSKHQRNSVGRPAGRANLKGQSCPGEDARARAWRSSASLCRRAL